MSSVSQEHLLPPVVQAVLNVLSDAPQKVARSSGFIQRHNKMSGVTGESFLQMLVVGWLSNPQASLDALVQFGAEVGVQLTPQGLEQRFTRQAVTFLRQVFEVAIAQVVVADPVAIPLVERFAEVVLEDRSSVRLPDELRELFRECGGSKGDGSNLVNGLMTIAAFAERFGLQTPKTQVQTVGGYISLSNWIVSHKRVILLRLIACSFMWKRWSTCGLHEFVWNQTRNWTESLVLLVSKPVFSVQPTHRNTSYESSMLRAAR